VIERAVPAARPAADAAAEKVRGREDVVFRHRIDVRVAALGHRERVQRFDLVHADILCFSGNKEGRLAAAPKKRLS